jgi:hypothetical protein
MAANTLIAPINIVRSERVVRFVSDLGLTKKDPLLRAQWQSQTDGTVDATSWIATHPTASGGRGLLIMFSTKPAPDPVRGRRSRKRIRQSMHIWRSQSI